jgi:hypothetical protein
MAGLFSKLEVAKSKKPAGQSRRAFARIANEQAALF